MPSPMIAPISTNVEMLLTGTSVLASPRSEARNPNTEAAGIMALPITGDLCRSTYRKPGSRVNQNYSGKPPSPEKFGWSQCVYATPPFK
jgi:hypothetical protein